MKLVIPQSLNLFYVYSNVIIMFMKISGKAKKRIHNISFEIKAAEIDLQEIGGKAVEKLCKKYAQSNNNVNPTDIQNIELSIHHIYKSERGHLPIKSRHIIEKPEDGQW